MHDLRDREMFRIRVLSQSFQLERGRHLGVDASPSVRLLRARTTDVTGSSVGLLEGLGSGLGSVVLGRVISGGNWDTGRMKTPSLSKVIPELGMIVHFRSVHSLLHQLLLKSPVLLSSHIVSLILVQLLLDDLLVLNMGYSSELSVFGNLTIRG